MSAIFDKAKDVATVIKKTTIDCSKDNYVFNGKNNALIEYITKMESDDFTRSDVFNLCELLERLQEVISLAITKCEEVDEIKLSKGMP